MADLERRIVDNEIRAAHAGHHVAFEPLPFSAGDVRHEIKRMRNSRRRKIVLAIAVVLLAAFVAVVCLVFRFPAHLHTVESVAMEPAIELQQTVYVQDVETLNARDVVMYKDLSGDIQFRRVIAVPGEWVGVTDDMKIALSDKTMTKGAIVQRAEGDAVITACAQLPENTYFLLGDAETATKKSLKDPEYFVLIDQIKGRVTFKVWPLPNVGPVF